MSPLPEILFAIPRNPILAVGLPIGLGFASAMFISPSNKSSKTGAWYTNMRAPAGTPPNATFPIVWTALYAAMGYASHLTVKAFDSAATPSTTATASSALTYYYAQLALNLLWSPLFFGAQQKTLALGNILLITGTAAKSAYDMYLLDGSGPGAAKESQTGVQAWWLMAPYLGWLAYATYLNAGYVYLNKDAPGPNKRIP